MSTRHVYPGEDLYAAAVSHAVDDALILHGGRHQLNVPITGVRHFNWQSAGDGVAYVSGGKEIPIGSWSVFEGAGDGMIVCAELDPDTLTGGSGTTRGLTVNGRRAVRSRARWKGTSTNTASGTVITTANSYLDGSINPTAIELLWRIQTLDNDTFEMVRWREPRCPVASISGGNLTPAQPGYAGIRVNNAVAPDSNVPTHVENCWEIFSFLCRRGTFYYDLTGSVPGSGGVPRIYYVRRKGEQMATARCVVSDLEQLIVADNLTNASFTGSVGSEIVFCDTQWNQAGSTSGHPEIGQLSYLPDGATELPRDSKYTKQKEALSFTRAGNVRFSRCQFRHMSTCCLGLADNSHDWEIDGCAFIDNGGNCIQVGNSTEINPAYGEETRDIDIHDCIVDRPGQEFSGGVGLLSFYAKNLTVTYSEFYNGPYSLACIGWGLGFPRNLMGGGAPPSAWTGLTPANVNVDFGAPIEFGTRFTSSVLAPAIGVQFYKSTSDTGTHIGRLWEVTGESSGRMLAQVTFANESASGWQVAYFAQPVMLEPGKTYIIARSSPTGFGSFTGGAFNSALANGPLTAAAAEHTGVATTSVGAMPFTGFDRRNFTTDVVIGNAHMGTVIKNCIFKNGGLSNADGGLLYDQGVQHCMKHLSVWGMHINSNRGDMGGFTGEIGMKFQVSVPCRITGFKFYKLATNTGEHVARLWSRTGDLLGTYTLADETASGWQLLTCDFGVTLSPDTTYVLSMNNPEGHAASSNSFGGDDNERMLTSYTRWPLTLLGDGVDGPNGVTNNSAGSFPTEANFTANFWFEPMVSPCRADGLDLYGNTPRTMFRGNVYSNGGNANDAGPGVYADAGTQWLAIVASVFHSLRYSTNTNLLSHDPSTGLLYADNFVETGMSGDHGTGASQTADALADGADVVADAGIGDDYADVRALRVSFGGRLFKNTQSVASGTVTGLFSEDAGTVYLQVKANFDGDDGLRHVLLDLVKGTDRFQISKEADGKLYAGFVETDGGNDQRVSVTVDPEWWEAGTSGGWMPISYAFDEDGSTLSVGGVVVATGGALTIPDVVDDMAVGNVVSGDGINADAAIAHLVFWDTKKASYRDFGGATANWPLNEDSRTLTDLVDDQELTASTYGHSLAPPPSPGRLAPVKGKAKRDWMRIGGW